MRTPLTTLDFEQRAADLYGSKVGIVDGEKRFTYKQFHDRIGRLSNAIRGLGVRAGERVAFLSYNCHQLLEAYYGVLAADAVLLPLNIRLTADELTFILNHAEARLLFFDADFLPLVQSMLPNLPAVRATVQLEDNPAGESHSYEKLLEEASPERLPLDIDEDAVAELFYTSGSTGHPKGVMMTHRSLYLHAMSVMVDFRPEDADVILHVVPLFHVNGWGTPHTLTAVGGTHVMLRKFSPAAVCRLIAAEKVTHLLAVPTMINAILASPEVKQYDLSSVHEMLIGGAPASPALIRQVEAVTGCMALGGYGLTETLPVLTTARPKSPMSAGETEEQRLHRQASAGRPIVGVHVRVVSSEMTDTPRDGKTVGEVVARGNTVMEGYFRDPDGTAAAIRDGWFHTGDMAVVDAEGYITIVDRQKDVIISGGENISSVEVEKALAEHPSVFESAVIAIPDEQWGEVPLAIVVLRPGENSSEEELQNHVRKQLAGFKVPRNIIFVEALPKGGTGKILKNQLRQPYWKGREKLVN